MNTTNIRVTMLGASRAGKTVFTMGTYHTLASGVRGLSATCSTWDDGVDLLGQMSRLLDDGVLPDATPHADSHDYRFMLRWDTRDIATVDWLDYRGGALDEHSDDADNIELLAKLQESDSIYVALDGEHVGNWIASLTAAQSNGHLLNETHFRSQLKIPQLTTLLSQAISNRRLERRRTSIAVILTKMDLLCATAGMSVDDAVGVAFRHLKTLMPFVGMRGVTAAVIPVKIGDFGPNAGVKIKPEQVHPANLHKPFLFSIAESIAQQRTQLVQKQRQLDDRTERANLVRRQDYERNLASYYHQEESFWQAQTNYQERVAKIDAMLEFYERSFLSRWRYRRQIQELHVEKSINGAPVRPTRPPEPEQIPREWATVPTSDLTVEMLQPIWDSLRNEVAQIQILKDGQRMKWLQAYPI